MACARRFDRAVLIAGQSARAPLACGHPSAPARPGRAGAEVSLPGLAGDLDDPPLAAPPRRRRRGLNRLSARPAAVLRADVRLCPPFGRARLAAPTHGRNANRTRRSGQKWANRMRRCPLTKPDHHTGGMFNAQTHPILREPDRPSVDAPLPHRPEPPRRQAPARPDPWHLRGGLAHL